MGIKILKKKEKWETFSYIANYGDYAEGGGIVEPVYTHKKLTRNHVARFRHSLYTLIDLSGCARNLIDYLSEIMDFENVIHNSETVRDQFIEFVDKATDSAVKYRPNTVAKAIEELHKKNLLIRHKKGTYVVNPIFFMRGGREKDRVKLVKMVLEFDSRKTKMEIIRTLEKQSEI